MISPTTAAGEKKFGTKLNNTRNHWGGKGDAFGSVVSPPTDSNIQISSAMRSSQLRRNSAGENSEILHVSR